LGNARTFIVAISSRGGSFCTCLVSGRSSLLGVVTFDSRVRPKRSQVFSKIEHSPASAPVRLHGFRRVAQQALAADTVPLAAAFQVRYSSACARRR
jgi:hypothetical protein